VRAPSFRIYTDAKRLDGPSKRALIAFLRTFDTRAVRFAEFRQELQVNPDLEQARAELAAAEAVAPKGQ